MASKLLRFRRRELASLASSAPLSTSTAAPKAGAGAALTPSALETLLSTPTWSVNDLHPSSAPEPPSSSSSPPPSSTPASATTPTITPAQLNHLLRLSALPAPPTAAAEARMLATLRAQLRFVEAVRSGSNETVEPLAAVRDETRAARHEAAVGVQALRAELEAQVPVGFARRLVSVEESFGWGEKENKKEKKKAVEDGWKLLDQAPRKVGRFVRVSTGED